MERAVIFLLEVQMFHMLWISPPDKEIGVGPCYFLSEPFDYMSRTSLLGYNNGMLFRECSPQQLDKLNVPWAPDRDLQDLYYNRNLKVLMPGQSVFFLKELTAIATFWDPPSRIIIFYPLHFFVFLCESKGGKDDPADQLTPIFAGKSVLNGLFIAKEPFLLVLPPVFGFVNLLHFDNFVYGTAGFMLAWWAC